MLTGRYGLPSDVPQIFWVNHTHLWRRSLTVGALALQAASDAPKHSRLKLPSGRIAGLALLVHLPQDAVLQQTCQEGSGKTPTSKLACSSLCRAHHSNQCIIMNSSKPSRLLVGSHEFSNTAEIVSLMCSMMRSSATCSTHMTSSSLSTPTTWAPSSSRTSAGSVSSLLAALHSFSGSATFSFQSHEAHRQLSPSPVLQ